MAPTSDDNSKNLSNIGSTNVNMTRQIVYDKFDLKDLLEMAKNTEKLNFKSK